MRINRSLLTMAFICCGPVMGWAGNSQRLLKAAKEGNLAQVQILIANGADVNSYASNGVTPIYAASKNGYLGVVKYLVEHGASLAPVAIFDQAPLYAASEGGNLDVVKYLLAKGADASYKNNIGQTAADVACAKSIFKSFCPKNCSHH